MTPRRWLIVGIVGAAVILLAGRALAMLYVEYLWYAAMGAASLWRAQTVGTTLLRVASALVASAFVFANLYAVRQSVVSLVLPRRVANLEIGEEVPSRYLMAAVVALSLFLGLLLSVGHVDWTTLELARIGSSFGASDPYFHRDYGFFVYWLPFERSLYVWALIAVLLVMAVVVFLYALTPSLRWERGTLHVSSWARRHLSLLGVLLLLMLAWSYRLDGYATLSEGSGPERLFTYVDHRVALPASIALSLVSLGAAVLVAWAGWAGQVRVAFIAVTAVLLFSLLLRQAAPPLSRRLAPRADPAKREAPYIATRMGFTRQAYATDRVSRDERAAGFASLVEAARGVPVWDPLALVRAIERTRRTEVVERRPGWRLTPTGIIAYAAERPTAALSGAPDAPWSLTRAHGVQLESRGGFLRVDSLGRPVQDDVPIPPALVYQGAPGYVVVPDSADELPAVELESGISRLGHAWALQNFRLLFGELPYPRPSIIRHRDVRDRVRALAPYFAQGSRVHPLVLGDSLLWVLDLYSASATFPLSLRLEVGGDGWSYFQHAATALVDGFSGEVTLVADSVLDPVARSWVRRFPGMFVARAELPSRLLARLPPAVDGAQAQAAAFSRYGNRAEGALGFALPLTLEADSALRDGAALFGLPSVQGEPSALAWATPVVSGDGYLRGVIVATGGIRPRSTWIPLGETSLRWTSVADRLRTATDTTGNGQGRILGEIRTIPLEGAVAFAQTSYDWPAQTAPTVARIALLAGDSVLVGETLAQAVGAPLLTPADTGRVGAGDFRARVEAIYEEMRAALRRGDWAGFGAAYDALGALLARGAAEGERAPSGAEPSAATPRRPQEPGNP